MKSKWILTLPVTAMFVFGGCDIGLFDWGGGGGGGVNPVCYGYDTIRIQLDSISLWSTADTGSLIFTRSFGKQYYNVTVSFYGETNIGGTTIPGESVIEYRLLLKQYNYETTNYTETLTGFSAINNYYSSVSYLGGDKITMTARYKNGAGGTLKHVGLKSVFIEGTAINYGH